MTENVLNTGHLTAAQRAAMIALADGATKDQAAIIANRTRRTVDRWLQDDQAFIDAVNRSTDETIADASRRLAALLDEAVDVMREIMAAEDAPHHVRLRAADLAATHAVKLREHGNLADRVTALEERISR